ncbi:DUF4386 domain-containing protein [Pseudoalteromonas sp. DL2-H2.2]|uniref:DUF4386 domain-containing protein n=1 Tax=Pseudoalteromonas sp. DL2-H2.2 TaxID=2908889 RepID=UPI001F386154|nr:DUF4386 domain-containing protein [Pseudoalteromonas sp. DL2-H2.2]MCF2908119.1 DUF4386 domain-containing protein [Pseudoalteromonas sp. DL2-H2.2]
MSHQLAARIAGLLFLISTSSYMYADSILSPLLRLPDFLMQAAQHDSTLALAALLEFINCAAVVGISILVYPIIKQYSERVAMGYIAGRVIEAAMLISGAVILMTFVTMGDKLAVSSVVNSEQIYIMGSGLKAERYFSFLMGMIALAIAGFLLNVTLFKYRLIPRLLSALGLLGYVMLLLKVLFDFFDVSAGGSWMYMPGALFELLLPLWLIFKGFDLSHQPTTAV